MSISLHDERTGLEVMPSDECIRLLASQHLGRIAVSIAGRPVILPVNYAMDGDSVVFRTDAGTKFDQAVRGAFVAFEIDDADPTYRSGWSVLVSGVAEEVTDPGELDRIRDLPLRPWAPGDKAHYVRVRATSMSGRRIRPPALA